MTRVGDVSKIELAGSLRASGIGLRTGAFTTHLRLDLPELACEFRELYGDYPIEDLPAVCDFRIKVGPANRLRRFVRPKAVASVDGMTPFRPVPARIAYPMVESALNWCIARWVGRYLLLHAAVVERDGYAVLLPAPSGSGKSTLCAGLVCRGWRLLTDEIALVSPSDGLVVANPRPIGLKNGAIDTIRLFAPDAHIGSRYPGTIKGTVAFMRPPPASLANIEKSGIPALVIFPKFRAEQASCLERVDRASGFMALVQNAINYQACLRAGFETLAGLVDSCDLYALSYSDLDEAIGIIDRLHRSWRLRRDGTPAEGGQACAREGVARSGQPAWARGGGLERVTATVA